MKKLLIIFFILASFNVIGQTSGGGVIDIEGNTYSTVWIGGIEWMAENLRTKTYKDGSIIPTEQYGWGFQWDGLQCTYNDNTANEATYGVLYNHYVVDNVCPTGWHVPTMEEISILRTHLGNSPNNVSQSYGGSLKSTGTLAENNGLWKSPNEGATNATNFNALPAGYRSYDSPTYQKKGDATVFWTQDVTQEICSYGGNTVKLHPCGGTFSLSYNHDFLLTSQSAASSGLSIRCVNNMNQVGLIELNNEDQKKELIKIVDFMGRETTEKPNVVLIYIYSDGSHERIFKVQN